MMIKEVGNRKFAIWLLGDSNPKQWQDVLKTPLDPRHPIRHNIWTPVLEIIQDKAFRECGNRMDTSMLYIRNAIENPDYKPAGSKLDWGTEVEQEVKAFRQQVHECCPPLLLCFGAFAFEFVRRALEEEPSRKYNFWGAAQLGQEFRKRVKRFDVTTINAIPLLHRSIAGGKFIQSHNYFCGQDGENYFEMVGNRLAAELIQHRHILPIWIQKVD